MRDRPSATEMLVAIGEFIDNELLDELSGPLQYKARVASNLVKILQRENKLANMALVKERDLICELMDMSPDDLVAGSLYSQVADLNAQLVFELEESDDPEFEQRVWLALEEMARDKVAIVRPGYDDWDSSVEAP